MSTFIRKTTEVCVGCYLICLKVNKAVSFLSKQYNPLEKWWHYIAGASDWTWSYSTRVTCWDVSLKIKNALSQTAVWDLKNWNQYFDFWLNLFPKTDIDNGDWIVILIHDSI